ncbi:MAG: hypothetical protein JWM53_790 [bacterium]|nr:hypothetical protein [bacterium]
MLQRFVVTLGCLLAAGVATADSARVRWRGVAVEGRAPSALQPAVAAHVAVALRSLGSSLVTSAPQDAEAAASCAFPSSARVARCVVVVQARRAARAERRAEIRYRDSEDLAESLALLVSDILTSEFPDIVGSHPESQPQTQPRSQTPTPTPTPAPAQPPPPTVPPPPTPEQQKAHEAEMQRQLEIVKSLQKQADDARAQRDREQQRQRPPPPPSPKLPPVTHLAVELGATGVFGLGSANPSLVGGAARALYARGLLRAGASLSLSGMRSSLSGHDLTFIRALVAGRAGIGVRAGVADFDLTAGPALLVLVDDAHSEGRHTVASLAFVGGPRLSLTLGGPIALVAGADFDLAITDEKVVAGTTRVAQFSRASVEATLAIAWRVR